MKTTKVSKAPVRKDLILFAMIIMVIFMTAHSAAAQQRDSTAIFQVETADGNEYIGKIIDEDNEKIRLKTDNLGELTLRRIDILKISPVNISNVKKGVHWFENPQSTRYFWSPNGYGLKKGEGYYQNIWVLFNQFSVGVTDNFSLGGGVVPLFLFAGGSTPVWFTPKFSIPVRKDKFNIGAGGLFGAVFGESNTGFGIVYGITTFGSRDKNLSLGLGYGYAGGDWGTTPSITISGMIRTGQRGYFLTENFYVGSGDDYLVLLSFGGRRIIKKAGLDFGLFIPAASGLVSFIAIPWLGLTVPFGNIKQK